MRSSILRVLAGLVVMLAMSTYWYFQTPPPPAEPELLLPSLESLDVQVQAADAND